jgi:hypothetical protein
MWILLLMAQADYQSGYINFQLVPTMIHSASLPFRWHGGWVDLASNIGGQSDPVLPTLEQRLDGARHVSLLLLRSDPGSKTLRGPELPK